MKKRNLDKLVAVFLIFVMIFFNLGNFENKYLCPGEENSVKAAEKVNLSAPSFAEKSDLMTRFSLQEDGTAGMIYFGTDSKGEKLEWYIGGRDSGVSGDNMIIFAASPIVTVQKFNSGRDNGKYTYEARTGYGENKGSIEVYSNHYGASELREKLNGMATDTNYFTSSEQKLLNATPVSTYDTKNEVEYKTKDKLYAPVGECDDSENLRIGSNDGVLVSDLYWAGGKTFWLRSAYEDFHDISLLAIPGRGVVFDYVNYGDAVRPASNLKLSSVLFASSATPASEMAESEIGEAMSIRYDSNFQGTKKIASTATADFGGIKVTKADLGDVSDLFLCVLGSDENGDWVYSKPITGDTSVLADDIEKEMGISGVDLSECKVWLESTADNLTYAKLIDVLDEHELALEDASKVDVTDENYKALVKYYFKCSLCDELVPVNELTGCAFGQIGTDKETYMSRYSITDGDWSTAFLMACMESEGYVEKGYITKTTSAEKLKEQVMKNGWYNYSFKQASQGDIAFMKVDGCKKTGIVSRVQDDKIYVVMGNYGNSDKVEEVEITKASGNIEMFGHIEEISGTSLWNYIENVAFSAGGMFVWPVSGENYIVTSCYGPRVLLGGTYHYGIDISCPTGTPIVAVMNGVVGDAGYSSSMGYYVVVTHSGGYQTTYMHNSSIVVKSGDVVAAGTVIALSGSTGQVTGPHSHLKVTYNGSTVDPAPYLGIPSNWMGNAGKYVKNN